MIKQVRRDPSQWIKENKIDFRVLRLSHAVVKEAEHLRGQEFVKRIENHPHREAFHADLQQNNVYNPFSHDSKAMIWEWVMESYLSFSKLHSEYNVFPVLFVGIKELCNVRD